MKMRILGTVLAVIVIVSVLFVGGFILLLGGGPKMFAAPNQYSLKMTVNMTIDGHPQSHVGGVKCSVKDQRGSIASKDWSVDHEYGQPFFLRDGGGALVLSRINPCQWGETSPQPGEVYQMDLLGDVYDEIGAPWGEMAFPGIVNLIDDAARPAVVRSVPLAHADGKTIWGARVDSITLEVSDVAVDTRLLQAVPAVAEATNFTMIEAALDVWQDIPSCAGDFGDQWVTLPADHGCGSSKGQFLPVKVSSDYGRIDVTSLDVLRRDPDLGVSTALVTASGIGNSSANGGSFIWLPELCVQGQCFDSAEMSKARWVARLINSQRSQMLTLSYSTMSTADWVDD